MLYALQQVYSRALAGVHRVKSLKNLDVFTFGGQINSSVSFLLKLEA